MSAEILHNPELPRRMGKLAIVRHGKDDMRTEVLTPEGRAKVERLAATLAGHFESLQDRIILTSTAPRALQSAAILKEQLGAQVEESEVLWRDNYHFDDRLEEIDEMIQEAGTRADAVVVVTHLDNVEELPDFIISNNPNIEDYYGNEPQYGEGVLIDFSTGSVVSI
jgi:phosphohistidine phosphatase SixA